jgi:formamidopyrimidine-DNA glycosylase
MFEARMSPHTPIERLSDEQLLRNFEITRKQMRANVGENSVGRVTTGRMNPEEKLWVYRRAGLHCRVCGTIIEMRRTGPNSRSTYWCPGCQPTIAP